MCPVALVVVIRPSDVVVPVVLSRAEHPATSAVMLRTVIPRTVILRTAVKTVRITRGIVVEKTSGESKAPGLLQSMDKVPGHRLNLRQFSRD